MASIIHARGGISDQPELRMLPAADLAPARTLILLVIDGLGADWLNKYSPQGLLARHALGTITSVFPTTTATAITTILTGLAPQQHAVTGWFTWLRELGTVLKILLGQPRYGGADYRQAKINVSALLKLPSVFDRLSTPSTLIAPRNIVNSPFNLALRGSAQVKTCGKLDDMRRKIERTLIEQPRPGYVYVYWPLLDHIGHYQGMHSAPAQAHLHSIERTLERLCEQLQGSDSLLLVTADHGQIDTRPEDAILLPETVQECLRLPLCGEPRAAFTYLRSGEENQFADQFAEHLSSDFWCLRSEELIAQGLFGQGAPHPELHHRSGDLTLIGQGQRLLRDRLATEQPFSQIGVHGGLDRGELLVPLCLLRL